MYRLFIFLKTILERCSEFSGSPATKKNIPAAKKKKRPRYLMWALFCTIAAAGTANLAESLQSGTFNMAKGMTLLSIMLGESAACFNILANKKEDEHEDNLLAKHAKELFSRK